MSPYIPVPPEIDAYAEAHTTPPPEHLRRLDAETRETQASPQMLSGAVAGRFLETLVYATGARRVLDIGTYSGYSALSMAGALPHGGHVISCEADPERAEFARRHIAASPHADRVEVRVGPALETIAGLDGPFDLVFIDADKANYGNYLDAVLPKLAERGLVAVDNTLWSGEVVAPAADDASGQALAAFNDRVVADPGLVATVLTVRDGITLIRRA